MGSVSLFVPAEISPQHEHGVVFVERSLPLPCSHHTDPLAAWGQGEEHVNKTQVMINTRKVQQLYKVRVITEPISLKYCNLIGDALVTHACDQS